MKSPLSFIQKHLRHQEISILMLVAAFCLLKFPLQHYFVLSRFQHYGICMYVWTLGYLLQTVWSWRQLSRRGRACLISTAIYLGSFATIFYENPWLDTRMAVETEETGVQRIFYAGLSALLGFVVCVFWLAWMLEKLSKKDEDK